MCQESRSQMGFQPTNAPVLCKVKESLLEELGGTHLDHKYVLEISVLWEIKLTWPVKKHPSYCNALKLKLMKNSVQTLLIFFKLFLGVGDTHQTNTSFRYWRLNPREWYFQVACQHWVLHAAQQIRSATQFKDIWTLPTFLHASKERNTTDLRLRVSALGLVGGNKFMQSPRGTESLFPEMLPPESVSNLGVSTSPCL